MGVEVYKYDGEGYNPTMHFETWRVAFLNYGERFKEVKYIERHMETDEVFVLLEGKATLYIDEDMKPVEMEKNKIYNITKATWHAITADKDAKVLIVENDNTVEENSE